MQIVKELDPVQVETAYHSPRRIVVLRREDGWYSYAEQYYYVSEYDGKVIAEGWHTLQMNGIYVTSEMAEEEGRVAFAHWYGRAG